MVECIHSALKMLRPRGIAGSCPATGTIKKLLKRSKIHTAIYAMLMKKIAIAGWMMNIENFNALVAE